LAFSAVGVDCYARAAGSGRGPKNKARAIIPEWFDIAL